MLELLVIALVQLNTLVAAPTQESYSIQAQDTTTTTAPSFDTGGNGWGDGE